MPRVEPITDKSDVPAEYQELEFNTTTRVA